MANKIRSIKECSHNSGIGRKKSNAKLRGRAKHHINYDGLLRELRAEQRRSVRTSLDALCHATI